MNTKSLKESLPDEHILQVDPRPRPTVDAGWRSRPNLYTGRTLSAEALASEQSERSGRLTLRGQMVAPGVVSGLEVRLESALDALGRRFYFFQVAPGLGLASSGEHVLMPRTTRFRVDRVPVFWLDEEQDPSSFDVSVLSGVKVALTHQGLRAAVLVLVPVVSRKEDPALPDEQGQVDPDAYSREDGHWVDGCTPVLFGWPRHWDMPDPGSPEWRNRLAWKLFEDERQRSHEERAPWEVIGVPLALIGFDPPDTGQDLARPLFADRAAVVRSGGAPRNRPPLIAAHGTPLLWQARIQQFSEHLASFPLDKVTNGVALGSFAFLPPVGILPKPAFDPFDWRPRFFPASFSVEAVPVPLEQLDAVTLASASLAPLDTHAQERVRVLVPVPEAYFEPRLLQTNETPDGVFHEAITAAYARLGEWLRRREDLRAKARLLLNAIEGTKERFKEEEPDALKNEKPGPPLPEPNPYGPEEGPHGTKGPTVPTLDKVLPRLGQNSTWAEPALLGFDAEEASIATDPKGNTFALVIRPSGTTTLSRTVFSGTSWEPWDDIPHVLSLDTQTLRAFRSVWNENGLALAVLVSEPNKPSSSTEPPPPDTYYVRIYHSPDGKVWEWDESERVRATRAAHFTAAAWGKGRIDAFLATELDTRDAAGKVKTQRDIVRFTWIHLSEDPPPVTPLEGAQGKQVSDMVALGKSGQRIELLFLARPEGGTPEDEYTLHHFSGVHTEERGELSQTSWLEPSNAKGTYLTACWTDSEQLDVLVTGASGITHGRYKTEWKFGAEPVSKTSGDTLQAVSRLDGQLHAFWWKRKEDEDSNVTLALTYAWFDDTRWYPPRLLTRVDLHSSAQPFGAVVSGTSPNVFLASLEGLQHLRMQPDSTRALVESQGLRGLVTQTQRLLNRVEDLVHAGSAQVQADTQNVRHLMISGHTEASRLAVSPILGATMVKSPLAARSDIESYFTRFLNKRLVPDVEEPSTVADAKETLEQATTTRHAMTERLITLVKELALDATGMTLVGVAKMIFAEGSSHPDVIMSQDRSGTWIVQRESLTLTQLLESQSQLDDALKRIRLEPDAIEKTLEAKGSKWGKSLYFSTSVQHLENVLVLLRELERRTRPFASSATAYQAALTELEGLWSVLGERMEAVQDEVAEGRQDVRVAEALLEEEEKRLEALNERRRQIYDQHVPFLVFQRPRQCELTMEAPSRLLDTGFVRDILPEVLASTAAAPEELRAYVELVRDSPLKWFSLAPRLLRGLDRTELVHRTFEWAQVRAVQRVPVQMPLHARPATPFTPKLTQMLSAREELIARQRGSFVQFEPALLHTRTWLELQQSAHAQLSLGDLIDAAHGRSEVSQGAAAELENLSKVATALYQRFGEVQPHIRLKWSEQMSQYDGPVELRDLSRLPQWETIEVMDRREMQALGDWIFQRVVSTEPEALALMNDLVRVCLLLASHAPVNELLSGHVPTVTEARVGGTLELAVDPARVRMGMHVMIRSGAATVQAVVEDLASNGVRARVLSSTSAKVTLAAKTPVKFSDPTRGKGALLPYVGTLR